MADQDPAQNAATQRSGYLYGLGAYGLWGVVPLYFKQLEKVPAIDIVAHRIAWSIPFLALLLFFVKGWPKYRAVFSNPRTLGLLAVTAILIAINWLVYVYAINSGRLLAGSLGYYLNPLANVLLGWIILKERLSRRQWIALAIAFAGVSVLAIEALDTLWISLVLCFSFATYGLMRKMLSVDSIVGLGVETSLLLPVAGIWIAIGGIAGVPLLGYDVETDAWLFAAGVISTIPLLFFIAAARRLPYSTVGMLQFLAPSLQFLLAVLLFGEKVTSAHAIAFAAIWAALVLYVWSLLDERRKAMG